MDYFDSTNEEVSLEIGLAIRVQFLYESAFHFIFISLGKAGINLSSPSSVFPAFQQG